MFITEAGRLKEGSHKPVANRGVGVKSGCLRELAQLQNYKHKKYKKIFVFMFCYTVVVTNVVIRIQSQA